MHHHRQSLPYLPLYIYSLRLCLPLLHRSVAILVALSRHHCLPKHPLPLPDEAHRVHEASALPPRLYGGSWNPPPHGLHGSSSGILRGIQLHPSPHLPLCRRQQTRRLLRRYRAHQCRYRNWVYSHDFYPQHCDKGTYFRIVEFSTITSLLFPRVKNKQNSCFSECY